MKHTKTFTLWGNMYACDGVYVPDKITSGSFDHCCGIAESDEWIEYNGTYITMYDSKTDTTYHEDEPEFADAADTFFEDMFDAYDYGPESQRIINGKRCVYWTDGMWISKRGIEEDEDEERDEARAKEARAKQGG